MTRGEDGVHHELGERRKELTLVHGLARALHAARPLDQAIVAELTALLPAAWQYPETCEARIQIDGLEARTPGYVSSPWSQRAAVSGGRGVIEVVYREERPAAHEGPFLREERDLIQTVAEMVSVHVDRWTARDALRSEVAHFRAIFDRAPIGIAVVRMDARLIRSNRALQAFLGYSEAELAELTFPALTHPDDVETDLELFASLLAGDRDSYELEKRYLRKDGTIVWGNLRVSLVDLGGDTRNVMGMVEDITARKAAEAQRAQLEAQLRQAQKMEAVGRLAGGVAHDFNNILTIIAFNCELLLFGDAESPTDAVIEIRQAAERATLLTRQLLAFSRKTVLRPVVIDLDKLVAGMESMLRRLIGEDVTLVTRLAGADAHVRADAGQLEQVLMNLAVNARDAMPRGGTLTLEVRTADIGFVELAVSDTGVGMDPETQARIFEPFFTTKEEDRGTGLGLSVVFGIVEQSGGRIEVASEPGHGATFRIRLPRATEAVLAPTSAPITTPSIGTETILVVEDDESLRKLVRVMLQSQGYQVLEARDGAEALARALDHPGSIQLLVTDVVLPGQPGREIAEQLRVRRPELEVLFISGYNDDALVRNGVLHGDIGFLQKPFSPSALGRKVREILDR